jgi:AraC family transcriptional regulator
VLIFIGRGPPPQGIAKDAAAMTGRSTDCPPSCQLLRYAANSRQGALMPSNDGAETTTDKASRRKHISPLDWRDWRHEQTRFDSGPKHLDRAIIQQWVGSSADMIQPPLDHHMLVLHEGGPKLVRRSGGLSSQSVIAKTGSHTTIEAGSAYHWSTEGPIAFTHLYVRPDRFSELVGEVYERDPSTVHLGERIGHFDPLTMELLTSLQPGCADGNLDAAAEYLLDALIVRIASLSNRCAEFPRSRISMAPATLRRVCDFIETHYADPITLDDMASVAGYSRFHFVRAFREATGTPPYAFLIQTRIRHAAMMLMSPGAIVAEVAQSTGFSTHAQFSTRFKEHVGVTPADYRRMQGTG